MTNIKGTHTQGDRNSGITRCSLNFMLPLTDSRGNCPACFPIFPKPICSRLKAKIQRYLYVCSLYLCFICLYFDFVFLYVVFCICVLYACILNLYFCICMFGCPHRSMSPPPDVSVWRFHPTSVLSLSVGVNAVNRYVLGSPFLRAISVTTGYLRPL